MGGHNSGCKVNVILKMVSVDDIKKHYVIIIHKCSIFMNALLGHVWYGLTNLSLKSHLGI